MKILSLALVVVGGLFSSGSACAALLNLSNTDTTVGWSLVQVAPSVNLTPMIMTQTPFEYDTLFGGAVGSRGGWLSDRLDGRTFAPSPFDFRFRQSFLAGANQFVSINFKVLHDNNLVVKFNDETIFTSPESIGYKNPPDNITFVRNAAVGNNNLDFIVRNNVNPDPGPYNPFGISVLFDAQKNTIETVPEPASIGLWACIAGVGLLARRRMRRTV
jgi:hypothetical protein